MKKAPAKLKKKTASKKSEDLSKEKIKIFMERFWEKHGAVMSRLARE